MNQKPIYQLLDKFNIQESDLAAIKNAGKVILPLLNNLISNYSTWLKQNQELKSVFRTAEDITTNSSLKATHWESVWKAEINDEYIDFRQKLGQVHVEKGVNVNEYFSILTYFVTQYEKLFKEQGMQSFELSNAFSKLVNLDISLVLDAYHKGYEKSLRRQNEALVASISTPVAQLWPGILFLPLVGIMDSKRAYDITLTILQKVETSQAKVFVLDISGVAIMDTAVANHFIKITKASKLMGCTTIISGISGAVAQTIVELGVNIEETRTTNSLQDALQEALKISSITV